ncbi:MAG TPA: extracellular solute-binding protein [Solirubrobacteraceae bacterium]|nr:extracellular solute-binding protein [Solirubrobacteraceae bacterium]
MGIAHSRSRRTAVACVTAALTAFAVGACGGSSNSAKSYSAGSGSGRAAGHFTVLVYGDAENKVERYAVNTYNATPEGKKVKAVLQTIPGADYQAKLQTIMSSSAAPDVFFNWGGGSIEQFQQAGLLMPLNGFFKQDPALKSSFLPSILDAAKIGSDYYGIPMRGTQPVVLFYNKSVLAANHLTPPATWGQLLHDVAVLKSAPGIQAPIALGGGDQWPTQMWYEYVYDRVAGPGLVTKALDGDTSVWNSAASKTALGDLKQLVNSGAFGAHGSWDSIKFTDNDSPKMLETGRSAFELMGSWEYSTQQTINASFAKNDLGYTAFPTIPGGAGNAADLVGNTENYYSVLKNTRYPQAVADFLKVMYSPGFVKREMAIGNLTTTTNTPQFIKTSATPAWLQWQYNLVKNAPAFQLSWDQAWPQTDTNTIHTAVAQYFDNLNPSAFISAMQGLQSPTK